MTTKTFALTILLLTGTFFYACSPSDAELKKEVNEKLSLIPGITADVKNGEVILSGEVSDEVAKSAAEEALKGIKGVKSVKDSITIKTVTPPTPAPVTVRPEEVLKKTLDSTYAANGINGVTVTISETEITLDGTAPKKQLRKVMRIAQQQAAARKVVNNLKTN